MVQHRTLCFSLKFSCMFTPIPHANFLRSRKYMQSSWFLKATCKVLGFIEMCSVKQKPYRSHLIQFVREYNRYTKYLYEYKILQSSYSEC